MLSQCVDSASACRVSIVHIILAYVLVTAVWPVRLLDEILLFKNTSTLQGGETSTPLPWVVTRLSEPSTFLMN